MYKVWPQVCISSFWHFYSRASCKSCRLCGSLVLEVTSGPRKRPGLSHNLRDEAPLVSPPDWQRVWRGNVPPLDFFYFWPGCGSFWCILGGIWCDLCALKLQTGRKQTSQINSWISDPLCPGPTLSPGSNGCVWRYYGPFITSVSDYSKPGKLSWSTQPGHPFLDRLSEQCKRYRINSGTQRNALAQYPWSGSVSWCLAEG